MIEVRSSQNKCLSYIYEEMRLMLLQADTITKDYVRNAGVFTDIFNQYIYVGWQVILPELLTERDFTNIWCGWQMRRS